MQDHAAIIDSDYPLTLDLSKMSIMEEKYNTSAVPSRTSRESRSVLSVQDQNAYKSYLDKKSQKSKSSARSQQEAPAIEWTWRPKWAKHEIEPLRQYQAYYKDSYKSFTDREVKTM